MGEVLLHTLPIRIIVVVTLLLLGRLLPRIGPLLLDRRLEQVCVLFAQRFLPLLFTLACDGRAFSFDDFALLTADHGLTFVESGVGGGFADVCGGGRFLLAFGES